VLVAVEIASTTTIHMDLFKKWPVAWPGLYHRRLEALPDDEDAGRRRHARSGAGGRGA
jgi:hypothetical protein